MFETTNQLLSSNKSVKYYKTISDVEAMAVRPWLPSSPLGWPTISKIQYPLVMTNIAIENDDL
jgi:hypothetical protein